MSNFYVGYSFMQVIFYVFIFFISVFFVIDHFAMRVKINYWHQFFFHIFYYHKCQHQVWQSNLGSKRWYFQMWQRLFFICLVASASATLELVQIWTCTGVWRTEDEISWFLSTMTRILLWPDVFEESKTEMNFLTIIEEIVISFPISSQY